MSLSLFYLPQCFGHLHMLDIIKERMRNDRKFSVTKAAVRRLMRWRRRSSVTSAVMVDPISKFKVISWIKALAREFVGIVVASSSSGLGCTDQIQWKRGEHRKERDKPSPNMDSGAQIIQPNRLNKWFISKFPEFYLD